MKIIPEINVKFPGFLSAVHVSDDAYQPDLDPSRVIAEFRENGSKVGKMT
jgi:hypothetical protein